MNDLITKSKTEMPENTNGVSEKQTANINEHSLYIWHDVIQGLQSKGMYSNLITYRLNPIVNVTPELAAELLKDNIKNRTISKGRVLYYASQMKKGKWSLTGETIKIGKSNSILDGQHRLLAVIESGCHVKIEFSFDIEDAFFTLIDTGKARSASDILGIMKVHNSSLVAAVLKAVIFYERGLNVGTLRTNNAQLNYNNSVPTSNYLTSSTVSNDDVEDAFYKHPDILEYCKRRKSLGFDSTYSFIHYILSRKDKEKADQFMTFIAEGEYEEDGKFYRNEMLRNLQKFLINRNAYKGKVQKKITTREIIGYCFTAWNYFKKGKTVKVIRYNLNSGIPKI